MNTNYTYDNLSRLLSVLHKLGATTIDGATYTVDPVGNRTSKTTQLNAVTENYGYDAVYQLLQVTQGAPTESYTYDPVGNRLSSLGVPSYTYNNSNQLTSTTTASYTYDNNGNTLTKTEGSNVTTYAWDFENRLLSITLPGSGGTVSFKYDPFGRRVQKASASSTTNYAYDGADIAEEVDSVGTAVARYTMGPGIDQPLAMLRGGVTSLHDADGLGSITSLTDAAGSLAATYTYDSFGKLVTSSGALVNPFRYTAREFDGETGLYYYRARYYDPAIGRFLGEDSLRFRQGINLYTYVRNRPTSYRDPSGHAAFGYGLGLGGGFGVPKFAAFFEGNCSAVIDTKGNIGVLCCGGAGAGGAIGGAIGPELTGSVCTNCKTICDLEGIYFKAAGFAAEEGGAVGSLGVSVGTESFVVSVSIGPAAGAGLGGGGIIGTCKLVAGRAACGSCKKGK